MWKRAARWFGTVGTGFVLAATLAACSSSAHAGPNSTSGRTSTSAGSDSTTSSLPTSSTSSTSSTTTSTTVKLSGQVTVLEIGDSLGEDLGFGLSYELANDHSIRLLADAVGDTGLVRSDYYDWPAHLRSELAASHPQIVVVFLGANDSQGFATSSGVEAFGTPAWMTTYGQRVAQIMSEATSAGARVIWVGMPIMQDPTLSSNVKLMNSIFERQAASHPGVTYLPSWNLFTNAAGQYTATTTGANGQTYILRDPDGIHLDSAGGDLLAAAVVAKMNSSYGLHLPVLQPPG